MKKNTLAAALLPLCCFALLAACGQTTTGQEGTDEGAAGADGFQRPFRIEERLESGSFPAAYTDPETGGEKSYTSVEYGYSLPQLVPSDSAAESLAEAARVFNDKVEEFYQLKLGEAAQAARNDEAIGLEPHEPYSDEIGYQLFYTDSLISVQVDFGYYFGGAHPNHASQSWLFDVKNAKFITPLDLAGDPQAMSAAVAEEILRQIDEKQLAENLWPEYPDIAAGWSQEPGADAAFIHGAGMTITFSPYNLAAYAWGDQVFEIPLEVYQPLLSDYGLSLLEIGLG